MDFDSRTRDFDLDAGRYALAIVYTLGYLAMVGVLMFFDIPTANREPLLVLIGLMSSIQLGIVKYFYDGTKGAERAQSAMQQLAQTAATPMPATGNGVATPAKTVNVTGEEVNVTEGSKP